jgi:hypothetical protein
MQSFVHYDVLELPRVLEIETIVHEFVGSVLQGVPVGIVSSHRRYVGLLNLQALVEVHLVTLHQSSLRVLHRPGHPSNYSRAHLKRSSTLVRSSLTSLDDVELGTIPIGVFGVAIEEDSELVNSFDDIFFDDFPFVRALSASD